MSEEHIIDFYQNVVKMTAAIYTAYLAEEDFMQDQGTPITIPPAYEVEFLAKFLVGEGWVQAAPEYQLEQKNNA